MFDVGFFYNFPVLYLVLSHAVGNVLVQSSKPGLVNRFVPVSVPGSGSGSGVTVPPPSPLAMTFTFLISQVADEESELLYWNAILILDPT